MKVKLAVAKLFLINKTIAGLNRAAEALRPIVAEHGAGVYGNYRVVVTEVGAHTRHIPSYNRVTIVKA